MMELISLDTLIKVYKEYSKDSYSTCSEVDIKELVEYCENVKSYLHSVHSTDIEFYKGMLEHDNFLDRMVTILYIFDNISDVKKYVPLVKNNPDYKLVRWRLFNKTIKPNREAQEQAYYEVFKNEILAKKREDILNQIL